MKTCSLCGVTKPDEEFNFKYKDRGIRQRHCVTCARFEIRRHYLANKKYYLDKARKRNIWVRQRMKRYVLNYLEGHPCVDCGETDPVVLEFDHVKEKFKEVSKLLVDDSLERLMEEISKCEVRCANCHRCRTVMRLNAKIGPLPL